MIGLIGVAKTNLEPHGHLLVQGELWEAISDRPVPAGHHASILRVEGLKLYVTPVLKEGEA